MKLAQQISLFAATASLLATSSVFGFSPVNATEVTGARQSSQQISDSTTPQQTIPLCKYFRTC